MGVPALFRWLSKKYPKIILPVEEEDDIKVPDENDQEVTIPVNMAQPNPNGVEFDNLYLDMNGIVHPCTHPEGKPAPETEEDMMVEVFKYTERVVNMVRPRKLLFMAIDGVAPRAKMNQQRSRRFRSAQEAKEKEEARKEALALWEAMGKKVSDEEKTKQAWDSNAITPGTPFMDLLAASLRYWVVQKMNTDPGWKNIQVIISDASVAGEGEHKIMDYIRRQRSNPGYDPNTKHVIYGLDADLIMLALATHEPHFRVLREDVFAQDKSTACRICGQEGHYAAQCTGTKAEIEKKPPPPEKKPFIFLDVAVLREYLEVELDVPSSPFRFDLEKAIDDWVLLIFFVGNDFLPHLPSLEIREGAIDTLLKIWKQELPRMGGYLSDNGTLNLARAQIILEGLAKREDEIFRRRREAEERQAQNAKRRKLEQAHRQGGTGPAASLKLTEAPAPPASNDFAAQANALGLGGPAPAPAPAPDSSAAIQALGGSNRDVVANRAAIRMAQMNAAQVLKAEMAALSPVRPSKNKLSKPTPAPQAEPPPPATPTPPATATAVPVDETPVVDPEGSTEVKPPEDLAKDITADIPPEADEHVTPQKRKYEEGPGSNTPDEDVVTVEESEEEEGPKPLKVNPDGTVEQEDTVKLWEPGYKERYYKQKFGVEPHDIEFRHKVAEAYVQGLAWVLQYYYQGTPSWQWYYPYHFAPFAADFVDVEKMDIKFNLGQPFKPYEQLMGVFPAASRKHIPAVFQKFMVDEDSPIIDFYPPTFEIDMNGKKMAWQGVALLPFIDETRLLDAMALEYPNLTEDEVKRNQPGHNVLFAADEHPVYPFYEALYGKKMKKNADPVAIDTALSKGISGQVLPNPDCLPGSTYYCPLTTVGLPDIRNDRSLSVLYFFPPQRTPHKSAMLPGARKPPRVLSAQDLERTRGGGRGRGGWHSHNESGRGGGRGGGGGYERRNDPFHSRGNSYNTYGGGGGGDQYGGGRNGNYGGYGGYGRGGAGEEGMRMATSSISRVGRITALHRRATMEEADMEVEVGMVIMGHLQVGVDMAGMVRDEEGIRVIISLHRRAMVDMVVAAVDMADTVVRRKMHLHLPRIMVVMEGMAPHLLHSSIVVTIPVRMEVISEDGDAVVGRHRRVPCSWHTVSLFMCYCTIRFDFL
ncbi:5'-3' exoribonuclease 2 [Coprinopsis cinerea AmutBmut pab1-1]|nr:5'-3' exoribonuclease 2 [Coprinopsis cinerea AmutBmut pab1-1]